MLVQVSMGTENFVIFLSLSFQGNLPITFKRNEDIGKFLWKIQKNMVTHFGVEREASMVVENPTI